MISKSFIKSSLIYTVAGSLPMASGFILLPFYFLYLPTDAYGVLAICLAFAAGVQILTTYSFDTSLYIHYHELKDEPEKLGSLVSSAFLFMLVMGIIIGSVLSLSGSLVFELIRPNSSLSFYPYGMEAVGIGVCQALFKVHGQLLQTREKPVVFFWSNVFVFTIIAITTIVGLKLYPGTLIGPMGGRLLATSVIVVWVLFRVFSEYGFHFTSPWKNTSFSFNAFTFVYQLQQWVINYVDRFVILLFMPAGAISMVGIYEFAIKCLAPIELVLNGLNATVFPRVIKLITGQEGPKTSTPEINRYFYGQVSIIMIAICASIIGLPWVIELFVTKSNYHSALHYIPYLAVIFLLKTVRLYFIVPNNVLKKMKRLTGLNFFVSLTKIGLIILFIARWELFGVIIASGTSYLIEIILLQYYLRRDYAIRFNYFKLYIAPGILGVMILVLEPLLGQTYPNFLHIGYVLLCVALLWFTYRKEIVLLKPDNLLK